MIGCDCPVCKSDDPRNQRTRSSLFLSGEGYDFLIDTPPDLRLQLCREGISQIERVLVTHSHFDHVMGMDDLRRINEMTGESIPVYAQATVQDDLRRIFRYVFQPPTQVGGGLPKFTLHDCGEGLNPDIELFEVLHGSLPVLGVKVRRFAYLTDVSAIPGTVMPRLRGLETLVIDATRRKPHPTHLNYEQTLAVIEELQPERAYLTHLSHDYEYHETNKNLPKGTELSYDGLRIGIS
jgi:phosphoribosyl 1,2-cyclic phosphate phosphodiesterase